MKILVTGAAGFIGSKLSEELVLLGHEVTGIDNLNSYYSVNLKKARLKRVAGVTGSGTFHFVKLDLNNRSGMEELFAGSGFDKVINLAAQSGVRYSKENPLAFIDSNITGFVNVLENCRQHQVKHLVYASSSSVYGLNNSLPYTEHANTDHPLSVYAASKKANELLAHSYSHQYRLPVSGLRFFTVYGPWDRPDMALQTFTRAILAGKPIDVYNHGMHTRDFTFIDDAVSAVIQVLNKTTAANSQWGGKSPNPATSSAPWRIYNIGNQQAIALTTYIEILEQCLGKKAKLNLLPMQSCDLPDTCADTDALTAEFDYKPDVSLEEGIKQFSDWYRWYYRPNTL